MGLAGMGGKNCSSLLTPLQLCASVSLWLTAFSRIIFSKLRTAWPGLLQHLHHQVNAVIP